MNESASIGIPALDKALMGGVPQGFTILVYGSPGEGMELFAKQFASGATKDESVAYISTTERNEDVIGTMKEYGWDNKMNIINIGTEYYEKVLARKLAVSKYRQEGVSLKDIRNIQAEELSHETVNLLTKLTYEMSKLDPPFRIIIDSLDFFLTFYEHSDVLSALRTIKAHTQHNNGVALITMLEGVYQTRTQSGIEEIVDVIIELNRERDGSEFKRNMVLRKVRNNPGKTRVMSYKLTNKGFAPD
ncbi:MAG TPA: recombinase RecA [Euryarchaeota archaeon]|nr:recombinase RecA [Euryarchaeota archaeon]